MRTFWKLVVPGLFTGMLLATGPETIVAQATGYHNHNDHEGLPCGDCYEAGLAEFVDESGEPTGRVLGEHSFHPACGDPETWELCPLEGRISGPIPRDCDGELNDFTCHNGVESGTCESSHYDPGCQEVADALTDLRIALEDVDPEALHRAVAVHESLRLTGPLLEITECDSERVWLRLPETVMMSVGADT